MCYVDKNGVFCVMFVSEGKKSGRLDNFFEKIYSEKGVIQAHSLDD